MTYSYEIAPFVIFFVLCSISGSINIGMSNFSAFGGHCCVVGFGYTLWRRGPVH